MNHPIVLRTLASAIGAVCFAASLPAAPVVELPERIDLDAALTVALENNYTIRQARARYAESVGAVEAAQAGHLPSVTASAGYSHVDRELLEGYGSPKSWDVGVEAQQTLYSGGAVEAGVRASRASRESSAADFDVAVQSALLGVRRAFLAVLLARQQVAVQEENIKLLEEELANARARVEAGSGSPFDQLRAEVALANGQPVLLRARNAYRLAAVDLMQVLGLPAPENVEERISGSLAYAPQAFALESLLASARANRAELRSLEQAVAAAEHSVDGARAGTRPTAGVYGSYGVQKSSLTDRMGDTVDGWSVGVQGSWPIFDGMATRGRVAQARSRVDQARLAFDEAVLAIDAEVRGAFLSYGNAAELVAASQKVVGQAEESLRLARARYAAGAATQLDVLQAQVALTQARSNEAQALHDAALARATLERAAGLGLVTVSVR